MEKKDKKRIAIVYHLDHPGGVQSCVISLIQGLNAKGIVPDLLWDHAPDKNLVHSKQLKLNFRRISFRIDSNLIKKLPVTIQYLGKIFNTVNGEQFATDYDFFYIFYNGFLIAEGMPHIRYLSGPPLLPQLENPRPRLAGMPYRLIRWVYRKQLRKWFPAYEYHENDDYLINSQYTADLFEEAHQIRLPVLHPPIRLNGHAYQENDLDARDTVTFFSRFTPAKRAEKLLEIAERYSFRFVFMGGVTQKHQAYYEALRESALSIKNERVVFHANPENECIQKELSRSRFYIFPAINEHFGMTTAESIASGVIPFVHDSGGQKEIVPIQSLRFDDKEFQEKFHSLVNSPDQELNAYRRHLNEHVQRFSAEHFNTVMLSKAGIK